jgi:hypothetical protein
MAWPTTGEVTTELGAYGVTLPTGLVIANKLNSAISRFEKITGYSPFLADEDDQDVLVDPSFSPSIILPCGFVNITSVADDALTLTANEDWWPGPTGAPTRNAPYTFITLATSTYARIMSLANSPGHPAQLTVVGKRGYAATLPQDAFEAVMMMTVASIMRVSDGSTGSISELKQQNLSIKYGKSSTDQPTLLEQRAYDLARGFARY